VAAVKFSDTIDTLPTKEISGLEVRAWITLKFSDTQEADNEGNRRLRWSMEAYVDVKFSDVGRELS
jgi:hypothetical protein